MKIYPTDKYVWELHLCNVYDLSASTSRQDNDGKLLMNYKCKVCSDQYVTWMPDGKEFPSEYYERLRKMLRPYNEKKKKKFKMAKKRARRSLLECLTDVSQSQ